MTTQNPATPAPAATPGNVPQNGNQTPVTPSPAPSNNGAGDINQEGKVTISTTEFARLQRDAARTRSAEKRESINRRRSLPPVGTNGDPDAAQAIQEANERAAEAERKALQIEVKGKVRDLLEKEEFKSLPKSTKAVIMANPGILTQADNLEEALLDIEDHVRDIIILDMPQAPVTPPVTPQPAGHDAPPTSGGAPAPANPVGLEDLSKLSGPARSQAALRNKIRQAKGVK